MQVLTSLCLKTAPSYFQEKMASHVLRGLLYFICEVYIDDIIIGEDSEEDLIWNLRLVFTRLVKDNVKLNPKKLKIGLTEIEYVGHILSAEGVNMTGEKILKVQNFVRPQTVKTIRSFLGLTAYFHKHILNYSDVTRPLHKMLTAGKTASGKDTHGKNKPIIWDDECMFQTYRQEVYHIAFMSKSLTGAQLNWSVKEKECYAIV